MSFLDDIYLVSQPGRTAIRELGQPLWTRAGISLHAGKTQIWNKSGRCTPGCESIFEAARVADPKTVVWKGDQTLPTDQQGVVVLGAPLGHAHFMISSARGFCCCVVLPRGPTISFRWCNQLGRAIRCCSHDENVWNCTQELLDIEGTVRVRQLSPHCGPRRGRPVSNLQAAATCRERLVDVGFDAPEWEDVARGQRPGRSTERDPTEPRFRVAMFGQR